MRTPKEDEKNLFENKPGPFQPDGSETDKDEKKENTEEKGEKIEEESVSNRHTDVARDHRPKGQ